MTWTDVTQSDAMDAVVRQLRSSLGLPESHCYETDNPDECQIPPSGDMWVTVWCGGGNFDQALQRGGGQYQCCEMIQVVVNVYTRIALDPTGRSARQLHDAARGLFAHKRAVLKAMVGARLTTEDGNEFLRQLVYAIRSSAPESNDTEHWARVGIEFGVEWDWDLGD